MKLRDILRNANANIFFSPVRSLLTIGAIVVGAITLTLTNGVGLGVSDFLDKQVRSLGGSNTMVITAVDENMRSEFPKDDPQPYESKKEGVALDGRGAMRAFLDEEDLAKILKVKGMVDANPMRWVSVAYIGSGDKKFRISVNQVDPKAKSNLAAGSGVDPKSKDPQVTLPPKFAEALGFGSDAQAVGKTVQIGVLDLEGNLSDLPATVAGITRKSIIGLPIASANDALIDAVQEIQLSALPDFMKGRFVSVRAHHDPSLSNAQIEAIKKELKDAGYQATTIKDQLGIMKQFIDLLTRILGVFAAISLFAASFGVINTLLMSVQERTKEIGLMKAMGMGSGQIFLLFSAEAILLGFWGSFLGVLLGSGVGLLGNRIAKNGPLKELDGLQVFAISPVPFLTIIGGIMLLTFIAGAFPSLRATRLDPITALRYE